MVGGERKKERKEREGGGEGGTKRVRETGSCEKSRATVRSERRRWRKRSLGLDGSDRPFGNTKMRKLEAHGSYAAIHHFHWGKKVKITSLVMAIPRGSLYTATWTPALGGCPVVLPGMVL